ncbi:MAG TPA: 4a-hydroxytetrahydrobiopterin dehydratase [Mariprofundaceae bacterium]|nr:4a-hydroxytetrahydrobiopterin dehydratase [Mariprofundaceae bacterium]
MTEESRALTDKKCIPCQGGVPPMTREAAEAMLTHTPAWELDEQATHIVRTFRFPDFASAQAFANRVGEIAEAENHHPVITYSWGYCTVTFYTHKISGLHENDFIMAAKVNALT